MPRCPARLLCRSPVYPPLLELPTPRAVLAAVQMNAIEFHTWNAVKTTIDKPDRIVSTWTRARACPGERQAGVVERDRAGRVAQDQRRQGPACAGAAAQAAWLGNHEGFFSGPGAASGAGLAAVVRQERSAQPGGQDLRGLPAQRLWRDDRGALVGAARRACRSRCRSAGTNWSRAAARTGPSRTRGSDWISAIVPGSRTTCATALARRPWPLWRRRGPPRSRCRSAGTNWSSARRRALDHRGRAGRLDIGNRPGMGMRQACKPWRRLVRVRREGARLSPGRAASGRQRLLHRRRRMPHVVFLFIERNGVGPCIQGTPRSFAGARPLRREPSAHVPRRCLARPRPDRPRAGAGHGPGVHRSHAHDADQRVVQVGADQLVTAMRLTAGAAQIPPRPGLRSCAMSGKSQGPFSGQQSSTEIILEGGLSGGGERLARIEWESGAPGGNQYCILPCPSASAPDCGRRA